MGGMVMANAKINKEKFSILKQTVNISKEDMEDYNLIMFTCIQWISSKNM
jgi:hypothetical protein